MSNPLKIISWNVNGIRAIINKGFIDSIKTINPDILCIQETKSQDDAVQTVAALLPEYKVFVNSAVKKGYSGTAIFTKVDPVGHTFDMAAEEPDQEGRIITLEFESFYLMNVYVPNSGQTLDRLGYREIWDGNLNKYIRQLCDKKSLIFTGDLNVANEPIDLARPKPNYNKTAGYTQVEIDGFKRLLDIGLVDTFRHFYKDKVQYTYWNQRFNARERNVGWRINYFLVTNNLIGKVRDSFILDQITGSDHCPLGIILDSR